MNADSLDIPLTHLVRWADTTATMVPHGEWTPLFEAAGIVIVGAIVLIALTALFASWAWRGFP